VGWWPGDGRYGKAAFFAYAHPAPSGFGEATLDPEAARWDSALGDLARNSFQPLTAFFSSAPGLNFAAVFAAI